MSAPSIDSSAELRKLAHALDVSEAELGMVESLSAADLRALRRQASEALFEADRHYFTRVAALAKAVPATVAAKLAEAVLPPLIAARTAELLEPSRAGDMVGHLSERYVAEVSLRMDAARSPEVVAAIPPARVAAVARELARREEWVAIGSFVSAVSTQALAACVASFSGDQLVRIGFVLEDLSRLDEIAEMLTTEQSAGMLSATAALGLWTELAEIVTHLSPERRAGLATAYAEAEPAVQDAFDAAAAAGGPAAQVRAALAG